MSGDNAKIEGLAKDVLNLARSTLVVNFRFMDRAISMLKLRPVKNLEGIMSGGTHIFYDPIFVLNSFAREKTLVTRQYLHMILHGVYWHFWSGNSVERVYWDLACDIAVEYTINDIGIPSVMIERVDAQNKEIQKLQSKVKYITADLLYRYFMTEEIAETEVERLQSIFALDLHDIWYMQEEEQAEYIEYKRQMQELYTQEDWKDISGQLKMDLESFSKDKGDEAGGLIQNLLAVTREKYDYAEFLKKFAILGERMKLNDEEFDYIFYTYGLQLYENMPLIEPLEYKEVKQIKEFVIAIDTSGSTSGELVQTFVKKTYNILKEEESFFTKFNIHIVQCDTELQECVKITDQQEFDDYLKNMKIHGLGGTDFRPVFSYVDQLIEQKEFRNLKGMIYFTDGFGTFPEKQPDYDVAFVYVDEGYENPKVPVWAIKLVLWPDEIRRI